MKRILLTLLTVLAPMTGVQAVISSSATSAQLTAETTARQTGDTANAAAITAEATTRAAADTAHSADITANAAAITAETNRATAAEAAIASDLADEVAVRTAALDLKANATAITDIVSGVTVVGSAGEASDYATGGTIESGLGLKVDDSQLSASGGADKVAQFNSTGNLVLRAPRALSDTGLLDKDAGNLLLTDRQMVGWYASDGGDANSPTGFGKMLFRIRQDNSHPYETNFDASGNICFYWGTSTSNRAMQFGDANGGSHYIYLHSGYASSGTPIRGSVPFAMNTMTWDGASSLLNRVVFRSTALDSSGTNSAWELFQNVTNLGSSQEPNGTKFFSATKDGVWSNGTAPAPVALTDGATITQTCSIYKNVQRAAVTLGGNRTLAISGAVSGMRGILYVKQDATGSRTLTLPTNHYKRSDFALSTTALVVDLIEWDFDGTNFFFTIKAGLDVNYDPDALAFFTAASITDSTQKHALHDRVSSLKSAGLWTKIEADYPMVGGNATAHSKDLKAAHNITWNGTITHDANGVTGDGSSGYGDTGINLNSLGLTNSSGGYVYNKTSSPTDGGYFFGATDAGGGRFGLSRSGAAGLAQGVNDGSASQNYTAGGDFRWQWMVQRSDSANKQIMRGSIYSTEATASTAAPNRNVYLLCRNSAGSAANFSNANIASHTVFKSPLSEAEWTTFRTIDAAYQSALGRANP